MIRGNPLLISKAKKDYLNLGCGRNSHKEFYNLDYSWYSGIDACWDVTKRLPFDDNSFRGVYSEHCLEHVPLPAFVNAISEIYRILRHDGILRVVVPDAELYIKGYMEEADGRSSCIPYRDHQVEKTALMSLNRIFRDHGHQYAWDFNTMRIFLTEAGFVNVTRCGYREGGDMTMLIDSEGRRVESLYVDYR
jgi:predicted SAM-dependent methyltransferase